MERAVPAVVLLSCFLITGSATDAKKKQAETSSESRFAAETFAGMAFRSVGPAIMSGRISDIAVDPGDRGRYYVAVASGGVWKTTNAGTTWTPVFDDQGSYSIGCVTIDPNDPLTVWVGTGENNSQRSVGYGDGVYKSSDGGKTWRRMGLESSEHIGKILVDPRDSNVVYVAAQGPLWAPGGERGLFKTTDGGESWEAVLEISENTGVNEVAFDPRDPDVLYASAYQRRRHVWTLINGGPESALYKSADAGATWTKLETGLPEVDLGRIGIAVSPANPDVVYAIVEAEGEAGGLFRSTDAGSTWEKRSDYMSASPQYYNELVADPGKVDRVYSMDTWMHVTEDGGASWTKVGEKWKHVDNHALWIDPEDTDYLLAGCDGGVYESFDRGQTWRFKANLPVTQFYRIHADNDAPFYNVYGGTQDNATLGGPSRTTSINGITNADWYVTIFGDGFEIQTDPTDPDIVYSQAQYGVLARYDRRSGELVDIQPQPGAGEPALRWNWDSPMILSPHSPTRLYFAANRLFRSDDRGDTWVAVSPDLTRQIDRNRLEVMGVIQSVDAVAKNASTSFFGNIVSLSESPLVEGLLYVGTDDGLIHVSEDGGEIWRRIESFPGVPEMAYVRWLYASVHDPDTVFAAFDDHKKGDFRPYLLTSTDRGRTWTDIASNLPERGSAYCVVQDHERPGLLFVGTEFGLFFSVDGGGRWTELERGLPTIAVRDLQIQRRESDLVVGTFGRGIYILDDYSPLRGIDEEALESEAILFPVKDAPMHMPSARLGIPGKAFQGDAYYSAPNPPFGAVMTYYLRDEIEKRGAARREREREEGVRAEDYPTWSELRAEDREEEPAIVLTVRDDEGNVVRHLEGPVKAGIHRIAWDLRYPPANPTDLAPPAELAPWDSPPLGPMVVPGDYTVSMAKKIDGALTPVGEPQRFRTVPLGLAKLATDDREALLAFQKKTARLQRAVLGAVEAAAEARSRLDHLKVALVDAPGADPELGARTREIEDRLRDLQIRLSGDTAVRRRSEPDPPAIVDRVQRIVEGHWTATSAPTSTQIEGYRIAAETFETTLADLRQLIEVDLAGLEGEAEAAGAPWTPGRIPRWSPED